MLHTSFQRSFLFDKVVLLNCYKNNILDRAVTLFSSMFCPVAAFAVDVSEMYYGKNNFKSSLREKFASDNSSQRFFS